MINILYSSFYRMQKLEYDFLWFVQNRLRTRKLDFVMRIASTLGNLGFVWIVLMGFMMYSPFNVRPLAYAIFLGLCVHVLICNMTLKKLFARSRPNLQSDFSELVKKHRDYSFPSGHACSSSLVATILYLASSPLFFFVFPLALLICLSRIYLSVHYPSDVLVGIIIGYGIGCLAYKVILAYVI